MKRSGVPVHACNPSYSGGRDQEGCSSKPAQGNSLRLSLKTQNKKKKAGGLVEWLKALSSNPSTTHTKKRMKVIIAPSCLRTKCHA
jgi:hypothetical protein